MCARVDYGVATDTERLVRAARDGDRDAFAELYERFAGRVLRYARQCVADDGDAQDLCQDVFLTALAKIHQLQTAAAFGGWLRAITLRLAINRSQRGRRMSVVDPAGLQAQSVCRHTPEAEVLANERRDRLQCSIAALRQIDRQALQAFYLQGKSLREMSDQMQTKVGTLKRRLHDARKRLAEHIAEYAGA